MLVFKDVEKLYGKNVGLKKHSFTLQKGNLYLFVGENGSGKSTALKIISKSINAVSSGEIDNKFQEVVFLPEKFSLPSLSTVRSYLMAFCVLENNLKQVDEMMKSFNLKNKPIFSLSKGMMQKVGIIQTLLSDAELYLFDEPTDGLDIEAKEVFKREIQKLIKSNKTVVISTHQKSFFDDVPYEEIDF